jgi:hypothetical protein
MSVSSPEIKQPAWLWNGSYLIRLYDHKGGHIIEWICWDFESEARMRNNMAFAVESFSVRSEQPQENMEASRRSFNEEAGS